MSEECKHCSGTGKAPNPKEAAMRILSIATDPSRPGEMVIAEDCVAWSDVLAVLREFDRLTPTKDSG